MLVVYISGGQFGPELLLGVLLFVYFKVVYGGRVVNTSGVDDFSAGAGAWSLPLRSSTTIRSLWPTDDGSDGLGDPAARIHRVCCRCSSSTTRLIVTTQNQMCPASPPGFSIKTAISSAAQTALTLDACEQPAGLDCDGTIQPFSNPPEGDTINPDGNSADDAATSLSCARTTVTTGDSVGCWSDSSGWPADSSGGLLRPAMVRDPTGAHHG